MSFEVQPKEQDLEADDVEADMIEHKPSKLNKAYLRKLDRKFDRLFKGKLSHGRLTNTSKSVYSFEGEVLSEDDDEYLSDSSAEAEIKEKAGHDECMDFDPAPLMMDEIKSCYEKSSDED